MFGFLFLLSFSFLICGFISSSVFNISAILVGRFFYPSTLNMSSHFLDSVVSDEKSGINLIGVPCMLIVEFLLMLMKFCICFLSIFTSCFLAWISVFTHLEFILLNLQINIFLYVCKIFAIISLNIFSAPCSFSLLLVTPIMNVNVVNSVLHLPEAFVHSLFSLFFRLHFVD